MSLFLFLEKNKTRFIYNGRQLQPIDSVKSDEMILFRFIHSVSISIYRIVVIRLSVAFIIFVIQFLFRKENKCQVVESGERSG